MLGARKLFLYTEYPKAYISEALVSPLLHGLFLLTRLKNRYLAQKSFFCYSENRYKLVVFQIFWVYGAIALD